MEIDILDFVEQCRDLAKQAAGSPAGSMSSYTVFGSKKVTATVKRRIG